MDVHHPVMVSEIPAPRRILPWKERMAKAAVIIDAEDIYSRRFMQEEIAELRAALEKKDTSCTS